MEGRKKILEYFQEQKDVYEQRVQDGIERYRKGNAKLKVIDKNGVSVANACVHINQRSHEFRFGANVFLLDGLENLEKKEKYETSFAELFNMATLPFFWDALEPERGNPRYAKDSPKFYRRPAPDLCLEFCDRHGIEPREHALAYDQFFPTWLSEASVEEVKRVLERRYAEISERYSDKIHTIEVTNELFWEKGKTRFFDEPDFVEWCFKLAERYFPNNQLVSNEKTGFCWRDHGRTRDQYYLYLQAAMNHGARIDAIGMQYHLFIPKEEMYDRTRLTLNPEKLYHQMDLYATFRKPLQITEVTVPSYSWEAEDEALQAEIIEKLYSIWFSHPSVEQIIYWNLVDGYAHLWDPSPEKILSSLGDMTIGENYYHGGLLRFDLSPKPAYYKIKELTQKVWHTECAGTTNMDGEFAFRGFYGKYDLEICIEGKTLHREIALSKNTENEFEIRV